MTSSNMAGGDASHGDASAESLSLTHADRLRFAGFDFRKLPSGLGSAAVTLEWKGTEKYVGRAEGVSSAFADLRLAVEATVKALAEFTRHKDVFELVGVKSVRAFDANVVMVSVLARRDGKPIQLVGCRIADGDPLRSAVLATLQATNRLLGPPSDD
ncbi:MAG TPA: hypothetical protein VNM36_10510 [Gemmatimonadaceae bacterium]|jgi:hypothetical protein|nr:hypothetical protein [Gemmatimonadaceae bacterium]